MDICMPMSLTFVVSGEECPLHLWSVEKNVPYICGQWRRMPLTLVVSGEECLLHWWSIGEGGRYTKGALPENQSF
ncbi:unnamed protein product [Staurois parvus]|uniref:Uncharacterized protein n=1 Tax=Staurois parvus TaxID=386267 RepID=A0ABN9FJ43_9NEOB|nr:unnamed protein product [Staurois parvus]